MIELTETKQQELWEEVQKEFPNDEMMQQIHYIRLLHYYQVADFSAKDRVKFFAHPEKISLVQSSLPN